MQSFLFDLRVLVESLDKVVFLILGWLFGLLSPAIVDAIRKRREAKEAKIAFLTELHELQYRLANAVGLIEIRYGEENREFLEWIQPILKKYRGLNPTENLLKYIELRSSLSDEQSQEVRQIYQEEMVRGHGLSLKKYSVPLLDSKISSLSWFEEDLRNQLLEVKARLAALNENVDDARMYFNLTFQSNLSPENYKIVSANLVSVYKVYASQARLIADLISEIK